ncbi:MAG: esterase [Thermoplasmatales archaeon A-plasma]|jgi:acetyl esterase|nr:MAG: esterase [Thermoplasmatales archaeon A-plasma]
MALDPDVAKLLKMISEMNMPNFRDMDVGDLRNMMNNNPLMKEDIQISRTTDMSIGEGKIPARLYDPKDGTRSLILYFHGGGFVFGNLESHDAVCRRAVRESGCKVLSVDYRLAPEHKFPAAVEDAFTAYVWARKNARKLDVDPDRIAVAGDSAGGNLSAAVSLMIRDRGVEKPMLQVLFYPALGPDFFSESLREFSDGFFLTRDQIDWFGDMYLGNKADALNPYFSPILHPDLSGLPEAIIITGEHDPLRDQGETYVSRLGSAGIPVTGIRAMGMIHGFLSFTPVVPAAAGVADMVWSLVGKKLGSR